MNRGYAIINRKTKEIVTSHNSIKFCKIMMRQMNTQKKSNTYYLAKIANK